MTQKTFFIGHGSPMNIIENNSYTDMLKTLRETIETPKAIIVISAHRLTHGTYITSSPNPPQIYDFYGFPEELYEYNYTAPGASELAKQIEADNIGIQIDEARGIDHAARAVLCHIYPEQNIPVLEMSLDVNKSLEEHFALGHKLAKYREENILIIGSGNIIHNLGNISFDTEAKPFDRAVEMDNWFKQQIETNNIELLLNYTKYLPNHRLAIPTTDHYLPLLYVLGMKKPEESIKTIHESIQNGSISMRSIEIS
jgi:4,5-DOPA dioxygenase extradiol